MVLVKKKWWLTFSYHWLIFSCLKVIAHFERVEVFLGLEGWSIADLIPSINYIVYCFMYRELNKIDFKKANVFIVKTCIHKEVNKYLYCSNCIFICYEWTSVQIFKKFLVKRWRSLRVDYCLFTSRIRSKTQSIEWEDQYVLREVCQEVRTLWVTMGWMCLIWATVWWRRMGVKPNSGDVCSQNVGMLPTGNPGSGSIFASILVRNLSLVHIAHSGLLRRVTLMFI